jgi:hypothetical protein
MTRGSVLPGDQGMPRYVLALLEAEGGRTYAVSVPETVALDRRGYVADPSAAFAEHSLLVAVEVNAGPANEDGTTNYLPAILEALRPGELGARPPGGARNPVPRFGCYQVAGFTNAGKVQLRQPKLRPGAPAA